MNTPRTDKFIDTCGDYEKWHSYRDRLHEFARSLERENAALNAEMDRLRKDAERYRAIPSLDWYVGPLYGTYNDLVVDGEYTNHSFSKESLDAAIDAAMKVTK